VYVVFSTTDVQCTAHSRNIAVDDISLVISEQLLCAAAHRHRLLLIPLIYGVKV